MYLEGGDVVELKLKLLPVSGPSCAAHVFLLQEVLSGITFITLDSRLLPNSGTLKLLEKFIVLARR